MLPIPVFAEGPDPKSNPSTNTTMGRTLCYEVFSDRPLPYEKRKEILLAEDMLNHHFTWTCEELSLEIFLEPIAPGQRDEFVYFSDSKDPRSRIATGFTKVRDDEWNACVVASFCRWLSQRLPEATVALRDEGDYILAGFVVFRDGRLELDRPRITRQRKYLQDNDLHEFIAQFDEAVEQADAKGIFFNSFSARDYADRREIRALELTEKQLAKATLQDVAERLTWPWDSEWLEAA